MVDNPRGQYSRNSAAAAGLVGCHGCGLLSAATTARCPRCGERLHLRQRHSVQTTMALVLTSLLLYIPANVLPIMTTTLLGSSTDSTIMGGVLVFWSHGDYPIALIIFVASVVVPLAKLLALSWLCFTVARGHQQRPQKRTLLFRLTELVGRWSMVDVFVVAILVALVQLGDVMTIQPGPAAMAFAAVVVVTMVAAMRFDPRLIWDVLENDNEQ